ncbi:MAG: hypothetical protein HC765_06980 [Brachymonas sp.]|nr:hypothetical protein [Brachymonas sp.]
MTITRRQVFFIGGFDPKGPAYYHAIYQRESALQGAVNGTKYSISPRSKLSPIADHWQVDAITPVAAVRSTIECLRWDDIVRKHWARSPSQLAKQSLQTVADYVLSGALARLYPYSRPTCIAALLPVIAAVMAVLISLALVMLSLTLGQRLGWGWGGQVLGAAVALALSLKLCWYGLSQLSSAWFCACVALLRNTHAASGRSCLSASRNSPIAWSAAYARIPMTRCCWWATALALFWAWMF